MSSIGNSGSHYYPPVSFHFSVRIVGLSGGDADMRFSEVSGLSAEAVTEEVPEGGENRYVQRYPVRSKFSDLVLKRGLFVNSQIRTWIERSVEELIVEPKDVHVALLNSEHQILMGWDFFGAWATRWSLTDLNASNSAVAVESLTLTYKYFRRNQNQSLTS